MAKRRRTDNTMAIRRRADNTMAKRRRTDNRKERLNRDGKSISIKRTTISHRKPSITKKTTVYGVRNTGLGLGYVQNCGVNWLDTFVLHCSTPQFCTYPKPRPVFLTPYTVVFFVIDGLR
jgi:hypothetical protein